MPNWIRVSWRIKWIDPEETAKKCNFVVEDVCCRLDAVAQFVTEQFIQSDLFRKEKRICVFFEFNFGSRRSGSLHYVIDFGVTLLWLNDFNGIYCALPITNFQTWLVPAPISRDYSHLSLPGNDATANFIFCIIVRIRYIYDLCNMHNAI